MQMLYKYTSFSEYTERLVAEPRLWFSQPLKLNDPFECRPWFDFNYEQYQLVESMARHLRRANPGITADTAMANAVGIFLEGRHRRPEMWESLRKEIVARITQEIGILCLSATGENILMWSHYGKCHTGICLGFKWSAYTPFFGRAQKVLYSENLPAVDVFNAPSDRQVDHIFLTKFVDWNYEKEWRIIEHDAGPGSHVYPCELLRTITFGLNTTAYDRERVKVWAARRGHPIVFQECVLDERQFKLQVRETE
jgi:hypothetical protein